MADRNIWDISKPRITISKDELLKDLKAYSKTLKPQTELTASGYNKWSGRRYSASTFQRSFGAWETACNQAGLKAKKKNIYNFEELFDHIEKVAEWRGERPSIDDIKKYNKKFGTTITHDAYARRWGGYKNFMRLFSQYKMGQITKQELIDEGHSRPRRKALSDRLRAEVFRRDGYRCVDCGSTAKDGATLHVHHIIPVSKGGKNELSNLATNCDRCNLGKSDKILK